MSHVLRFGQTALTFESLLLSSRSLLVAGQLEDDGSSEGGDGEEDSWAPVVAGGDPSQSFKRPNMISMLPWHLL